MKIAVTLPERTMIIAALMAYAANDDHYLGAIDLAHKIAQKSTIDPADDGPEVDILRQSMNPQIVAKMYLDSEGYVR